MFAVSNQNNVYCILTNWCMCINISCGLSGFSNGTLERGYSHITLSPPKNTKPYLGHEG